MNRPLRSTKLLFAPLLLATIGSSIGCASDPPPPPVAPTVTAPARPAPAPPAPAPTADKPATPAPAEGDRFAKVEMKVQRVAGDVYMLEGAGGNIGVLAGEDGIVIVDDEFAPLAPKIRAALKGISDKPIKFVINTHWHGDHTGGNAVFSADGPIVAHENVRKRLIDGRPAYEAGGKMRDAIPPAPKEALPVVTFEDSVAVHVNGEDVRAIHAPHGHTDGDAFIFFPKANVVHMGDDFTLPGLPFVDVGSGGSVRGLIGAMDKAIATLPADVKVIPGHGALSTLEDVKKLDATLKDIVKIVDGEIKKKKTLDQVKAAKVLAKYDEMGKGFITTDAFLETVYKELTEKPAAKPADAGKKPAADAAAPKKPAPPAPPAH